MQRVYNFSAGPSVLPLPVLEKAAAQMTCYEDKGMSVMEMSHRSSMYIEIYEKTVALLRELMAIPENYKVLFIQGGATMQFSAIPMNITKAGKAAYIDSGNFAANAIKAAKAYTEVQVIGSSKEDNYSHIPDYDLAAIEKPCDYLYITTNNTIFGTKYSVLPEVEGVPLVADASSNILSEEMDITKFGLMFAGAQKNIGPAGMAIVIIRDDLLGYASPITPNVLNYTLMAANDSMINTPPTYGIYIAMLVFEWLKELGGVKEISKINYYKAGLLYEFLDNSSLFRTPAKKEDRSIMNVTFTLPTKEQDKDFVAKAAKAGFVNLAGHRLVGGMRASIYNAMPVEGIKALVDFMAKYEQENK